MKRNEITDFSLDQGSMTKDYSMICGGRVLAGGEVLSAPGPDQHQVVYVDRGVIRIGGQAYEPGAGLYRQGGEDLIADTDCALVIWTIGLADQLTDFSPGDGSRYLTSPLTLPSGSGLLRLDAVTFPPGSRAYRHEHSGPGTRFLLEGSLQINTDHGQEMMHPGDPWFEDAHSAVLAIADKQFTSRFVRVMVLPVDNKGKPSINYLDPADAGKPRLQSNTRYIDQVIDF